MVADELESIPQPEDLETERQRRYWAEERLRQAEEQQHLLLAGARDYAIVLLDPAGHIASWNEGAQRLTGYEADEVLGHEASLLFTAEDRQAGLPERELRVAVAASRTEDESWTVRKDGSRFWSSGLTTALHNEAGDLRGFVKIFRDLTERRQAQEALHASEERLRVALAAARMGTWMWDIPANKDNLDESLRRLLGLPPGQTVDTLEDFLGLVHPEDRSAVAGAFARSAREGGDLNLEFRVVWPDGSVHWLRDQGDAILDAQGRPVYLTGACVDITERKRMEEALRQARDELERRVEERTAELKEAQRRALQAERLAAIGQTVAGLAHEGRNALQTIRACSERLSWRLEDHPEALGLIADIQKAQDTLQRLFEDVRGYAAPLQLDYRLCNLAAVWREGWAEAMAQHPGRDACLEERTGGVSLDCEADPFRLGQVFVNIFTNALAACADPVRVTVSCLEVDQGDRPAWRVRVRDNGPGLTAEQRRNIFEPFYTTKTRGTGLGMAIARRIVEAHGGRITVGEAAGPGAEIVLTLPRRGS